MYKIDKKTIIIIVFIIILLITIHKFLTKEEVENELNISFYQENSNVENNSSEVYEENNKILVYITGAVKNEGVYKLKEYSRIADVIEEAGGLTEEANINNINLAYILEDGMKIHIPNKNENENNLEDDTNQYISKESSNTKNSNNTNQNNNSSTKVNINTATQTELETLPGIGPSTASNIIEYRKENGKFSKIEDIKNVSGIGDNKYSKIKDLIKV